MKSKITWCSIRLLQVVAIVAAAHMVSSCGAVYAWDTMQLRSVQKQAAQKMMADCNSGDREACAYVAGFSVSR